MSLKFLIKLVLRNLGKWPWRRSLACSQSCNLPSDEMTSELKWERKILLRHLPCSECVRAVVQIHFKSVCQVCASNREGIENPWDFSMTFFQLLWGWCTRWRWLEAQHHRVCGLDNIMNSILTVDSRWNVMKDVWSCSRNGNVKVFFTLARSTRTFAVFLLKGWGQPELHPASPARQSPLVNNLF